MKSAIFQILLAFCLLLFSASDSEALALKTEHFQFETGANGNLLACTEDYFYTYGNGNNGANSNQLISFGNWGGATTHTFTYDANGNRLTMSANGSTKSVVTASVVGVVDKVLESGSNIGNVKGIFDGIHHSEEKVGNVAFNARHSGDSLTWSWLKGTATALGEVTGANGIVEAGLERELGTRRPLSDEERVGRFFGGISQMVSLASAKVGAKALSGKSARTLTSKTTTSFTKTGALGGRLYPEGKLQSLVAYLNRRGVDVYEVAGNARFTARANGRHSFGLPRNPTELQVKHELSHYLDLRRLGFDKYTQKGRIWREKSVLKRLQGNRIWDNLNDAERSFSIEYPTNLKK